MLIKEKTPQAGPFPEHVKNYFFLAFLAAFFLGAAFFLAAFFLVAAFFAFFAMVFGF
jgi:hypothetical protein